MAFDLANLFSFFRILKLKTHIIKLRYLAARLCHPPKIVNLFLFLDRPICDPSMQTRYGVTIGETVPIACSLLADPPVKRFKWWRSDMGGKSREIPSRDFDQKNDSLSVIYYK